MISIRKYAPALLIGCIVAAFCISYFILTVVLEVDISEVLLRSETSLGLIPAQEQFDDLYTEVKDISPDTIISEQSPPVIVPNGYPRCIRTTAQLNYATDREFEDVIDQYTQSLERLGYSLLSQTNSADWESVNFRGSEHISVRVSQVSNRRGYQVTVFFGIPSAMQCSG